MSNKHFEVDAISHRKAKNKALRNGMTLKAYLKKLINNDLSVIDEVLFQRNYKISEEDLKSEILNLITTLNLKPFYDNGYSSFAQLEQALDGVIITGSDAFKLCEELGIIKA